MELLLSVIVPWFVGVAMGGWFSRRRAVAAAVASAVAEANALALAQGGSVYFGSVPGDGHDFWGPSDVAALDYPANGARALGPHDFNGDDYDATGWVRHGAIRVSRGGSVDRDFDSRGGVGPRGAPVDIGKIRGRLNVCDDCGITFTRGARGSSATCCPRCAP